MYWSPFQLLANQTSSGCGLSAGDLIGTGTLSSSLEQAQKMSGFDESNVGRLGCLIEATQGWKIPLQLGQDGEELSALKDRDEVYMEAWAGKDSKRIGFGVVNGSILPAHEMLGFEV
jgi:fumarylacetoacetase